MLTFMFQFFNHIKDFYALRWLSVTSSSWHFPSGWLRPPGIHKDPSSNPSQSKDPRGHGPSIPGRPPGHRPLVSLPGTSSDPHGSVPREVRLGPKSRKVSIPAHKAVGISRHEVRHTTTKGVPTSDKGQSPQGVNSAGSKQKRTNGSPMYAITRQDGGHVRGGTIRPEPHSHPAGSHPVSMEQEASGLGCSFAALIESPAKFMLVVRPSNY